MPKFVPPMTQTEVAALPPGLHRVGGVPGLLVKVAASGAASYIYRFDLDGRRNDRGLGSCRDVTLAQARAKAKGMRAQVLAGVDPSSD